MRDPVKAAHAANRETPSSVSHAATMTFAREAIRLDHPALAHSITLGWACLSRAPESTEPLVVRDFRCLSSHFNKDRPQSFLHQPHPSSTPSRRQNLPPCRYG
jgi:hypothetical protein